MFIGTGLSPLNKVPLLNKLQQGKPTTITKSPTATTSEAQSGPSASASPTSTESPLVTYLQKQRFSTVMKRKQRGGKCLVSPGKPLQPQSDSPSKEEPAGFSHDIQPRKKCLLVNFGVSRIFNS